MAEQAKWAIDGFILFDYMLMMILDVLSGPVYKFSFFFPL